MNGNDIYIYEPLSLEEVKLKNFYDITPWYKKPYVKYKLFIINIKKKIKRFAKKL